MTRTPATSMPWGSGRLAGATEVLADRVGRVVRGEDRADDAG